MQTTWLAPVPEQRQSVPRAQGGPYRTVTIIVQEGKQALAIEAAIKSGAWGRRRPVLEPWEQTIDGSG
jgi:hypothetical protein